MKRYGVPLINCSEVYIEKIMKRTLKHSSTVCVVTLLTERVERSDPRELGGRCHGDNWPQGAGYVHGSALDAPVGGEFVGLGPLWVRGEVGLGWVMGDMVGVGVWATFVGGTLWGRGPREGVSRGWKIAGGYSVQAKLMEVHG